MSESGVKDAVARRVVRPHELQQWHRNWNGTPNRKMLGQHDIETAIEYLPRPRQWPSPPSASPALRHSREMTRACSRNLTLVARLRRG
jgi:hypothetical protein